MTRRPPKSTRTDTPLPYRTLFRPRLVFLSQGQIIARSDAERELDTDLSGEIGVRDGKTIFFRPQFGFGERHSCAPAASKIESLVDRDGGFGAVEARIRSGSGEILDLDIEHWIEHKACLAQSPAGRSWKSGVGKKCVGLCRSRWTPTP